MAAAAGRPAAGAPSSLLLVVGGECAGSGLLAYVLEELERGRAARPGPGPGPGPGRAGLGASLSGAGGGGRPGPGGAAPPTGCRPGRAPGPALGPQRLGRVGAASASRPQRGGRVAWNPRARAAASPGRGAGLARPGRSPGAHFLVLREELLSGVWAGRPAPGG